MGTNLQVQNLTAEDFGGAEYEGCNEYLVHTKPEAVEHYPIDIMGLNCATGPDLMKPHIKYLREKSPFTRKF
ncbi:hypothetical protein ACN4EE_14755 [Geminocystis sp. CENA526]|uniref:hypothetical protein n=1 Tax=Geminocystis sp. CENA526 TaxID=1355871 RepID=UPI003D6F64AA